MAKTTKTTMLGLGAITAGALAAVTACGVPVQAAPMAEKKPVKVEGGQVVVPLGTGMARVAIADLGVTAQTGDGGRLTLSAPTQGMGEPGKITHKGGTASWSYPARGITVSAQARAGRLAMHLHSDRSGDLRWPLSGMDRSTSRLSVPTGEGLGIPVDDPFWNSAKAEFAGSEIAMVGGMTMPFWGFQDGSRSANYIVPTDVGTSLKFVSSDGRLHGETTHSFGEAKDYDVEFSLGDSSPVASAKNYRLWLAQHRQLGSLRKKIARNPQVGKLVGAYHAYLWGPARSAASVQKMKRLGLDRMWLGYDSGNDPMKPDAVDAAKENGYLVGPYDSFANAQDPKTADNPSSKWPDGVYPDGCVHDAKGQPESGFGDRGCYLSSQYLAQQEPSKHYMAGRTKQMTANGANSYFLDVDAAGELFDDHSPSHPMTQAQDRANRNARMAQLSGHDKLVLGSENAAGWANQAIAFDHGAAADGLNVLWALQKDRATWGGYYPADDPKFFFKPVDLPADAVKSMYDPAYRLPLYETVLHDSVINLDRWELSLYKLPNVKTTRILLSMLYNIPLNFAVDGSTLDRHGKEMASLQHFFQPLHQIAATKPMTDFRWLTGDHQVQRTVFGDGALTMTANFGAKPYQGLKPGCVQAAVHGQAPRTLCP
ncbi:glycoside hydrolase [Actinomadura opuntiae]|uniref:glycoside hydrolase n=1 Tax=Actinomadura sp. OS1-43 TaxID=604315 RepID=UPI00255A8D90|nr:glycoside hydrolase [Actinomadura sp. OS1-43]MDL4814340.1 glycoside hydrolase [Actinomadura sp. OS1-43]